MAKIPVICRKKGEDGHHRKRDQVKNFPMYSSTGKIGG